MRTIATISSFFTVLALYFLYGFVLVPIVLPENNTHTAAPPVDIHESTAGENREDIEPFLPVLPQDGWEHDPKHEIHFLQFGTTIVLFGHDSIDGKMIKLEPCTVLIVPNVNGPDSEARRQEYLRETIVMRTQQYAEIEFEKDFDMSKLPLPKVVAGRLYGKVTVSSGMKDEGLQDDLSLEVENISLTETPESTKIETRKDVRFRFGYHTGEGTNLTMELSAIDDTATAKKELSSVVFQRLKTLRLVFPEDAKVPYKIDSGFPVPDGPATAVDVRCQRECGFVWDTNERGWQCKFNGDVNITRTNPDKKIDSLSADEVILTLLAQPLKDTRSLTGNFGSMQPSKFIARGKRGTPARLSVKHGSDVALVGDEIFIDMNTKMLKLSTFDSKTEPAAGKNVEMILQGIYSIKSDKTVQYTMGENGSFGAFVSEGKGTLDGNKIHLAWNEMQMSPHPLVKDQLVVKLGGGIQSAMDGFGTLTAREIEIVCNMTGSGAAGKTEFTPDHIIVKDKVRFATNNGTCDVNRLDMYFTNVDKNGKVTRSKWTPQAMLSLPPVQHNAVPRFIDQVQFLQPLQPAQANPPVANLQSPKSGNAAIPLANQHLLGLQSSSGSKFAITGNLMKMQIRQQNGQSTAEIVSIEGKVKINEVLAKQTPLEDPFGLTGDSVTIWEPAGNTSVKITSAADSQGAFIKGRGVEMYSKELNMTRADNQCWSPYPGRLVAKVSGSAHSLTPQTAALLVEWNKNMLFDGKILRFFGQNDKTGNRVRILYQTQALWCDTLEIYLNRQVSLFEDKSNVPPKAEMLQCAGGVFVRSTERDAAGKQTATATAEAELLRYYIDKNFLVAEGPGRMSTTFVGNNQASAKLAVGTNKPASLNHLSVWFQDTLQGTMLGNMKNIDLAGRIEVAYFPAATWDDTIAHENFAAARKVGCTLECEKLKVSEIPNPAVPSQSTYELSAEDDAVIDGYGVFGKGQRIKYSQLKNTVRFEGNVKLKTTREGQAGDYGGESIEYNIETGSVTSVAMQGLNINR